MTCEMLCVNRRERIGVLYQDKYSPPKEIGSVERGEKKGKKRGEEKRKRKRKERRKTMKRKENQQFSD